MMNGTFNIQRFFAYAAKSYSENYKKYLAVAGLMIGVWFLVTLWTIGVEETPFDHVPWVYFGVITIIAGILMVQMETKAMRGRHTSAITGTLPCSLLERFLFVLLNTTVVLLAAASVLFLIAAGTAHILHLKQFPTSVKDMHMSISILLPGFVLFHAVVLFATTTRIKNQLAAFVVTLFTAGVLMVTPLLLPMVIDAFTGEFQMLFAFDTMTNTLHSGDASVSWMTQPILPWYYSWSETVGKFEIFWDIFVWAAILWVAAYFNFRERQNA